MLAFDDFIYVALLFSSLIFGHFQNKFHSSYSKKLFSTIIGFCFTIIVCRYDTFHSVITCVFNIFIIKFCWQKYCHIASFLWCFGYLGFFRTAAYFGLPSVRPHSNAIQLVMTLKLIGIAYEVHDTYLRDASSNKLKNINKKSSGEKHDSQPEKISINLESKYCNIDPSAWDIISYCYCYVGLLTGPYFKFRTYHDMLHMPNNQIVDTQSAVLFRLRFLPLYIVGFFASDYFFPSSYLTSGAFKDSSVLYNIWYMVPVFFNFRLRFYIGWVLAESTCIVARLGAYPASSNPQPGVGPKFFDKLDEHHLSINEFFLNSSSNCGLQNKKSKRSSSKQSKEHHSQINFETVKNLDELVVETSTSASKAMRGWNCTVQWWMAAFVYQRIPSAVPKLIRVAVTMLVSAWWHGIYGGYYLSLLTIPFVMATENALRYVLFSPSRSKQYDTFCQLMTVRYFEYMSAGFIFLTFDATISYYRAVYFWCHLFGLFWILLAAIIKLSKMLSTVKLSKRTKVN